MEMGYAIALGVPIYTLESVSDPNLSPYCNLLEEAFPHIDFSIFEKTPKISKKRVVND